MGTAPDSFSSTFMFLSSLLPVEYRLARQSKTITAPRPQLRSFELQLKAKKPKIASLWILTTPISVNVTLSAITTKREYWEARRL
jgi:hypothetical protein